MTDKLEYWYVNDLLVQNRETRDWLIMQEFAAGRGAVVKPASRDKHGRWILPVNDPMEQ
jgi:hypothetical protein